MLSVYLSHETVAVCVHGLIGFFVLLILFSLNREGIPPGFRWFPASPREWLIYYLHTLESVILCAIWVFIAIVGSRSDGPWTAVFVLAAVLFASVLLIVCALSFWSSDRELCYRELTFCVFLFIFTVLSAGMVG